MCVKCIGILYKSEMRSINPAIIIIIIIIIKKRLCLLLFAHIAIFLHHVALKIHLVLSRYQGKFHSIVLLVNKVNILFLPSYA